MTKLKAILLLVLCSIFTLYFINDNLESEEIKMKNIWIIGASEGIGKELAYKLGRNNFVFLSARQQDKLNKISKEIGDNAKPITLDVSDKISIEKAYSKIQKKAPLDIVIYAAGIYKPMSSRNFDIELSKKIIDINLTGAMRILSVALPSFIKTQKGHIVMIGSVAGYIGLPNSFGYGASKAALIHLAENLKSDLYNDNIKIQVINPGFVKTRLTDMNNFHMPSIISAKEAAHHIVNQMNSNSFESRFPFTFPNFIKTLSMLPYSIYFKIVQFIKPKEIDHETKD